MLGVLNERPFGPCFNTRVDIKKLEAAILAFMEDDEMTEEKYAKADSKSKNKQQNKSSIQHAVKSYLSLRQIFKGWCLY